MNSKGNFVALKIRKTVPLPNNPEQFRQRVEVWGQFLAVCLLHAHEQALLKGTDQHAVDVYIKYFLGKHVMGLVAKGRSSGGWR